MPTWGHFRHLSWPRWVKFGQKRVLSGYLHQKREFSRNITFSNTKTLFLAPRWPPKCRKIGPRALREQLFSVLKIVLNFHPSWVRFWLDFGFQHGTQNLGWCDAKPFFFLNLFCMFFLSCFGRLQVGPRGAQKAPRPPLERPLRT